MLGFYLLGLYLKEVMEERISNLYYFRNPYILRQNPSYKSDAMCDRLTRFFCFQRSSKYKGFGNIFQTRPNHGGLLDIYTTKDFGFSHFFSLRRGWGELSPLVKETKL